MYITNSLVMGNSDRKPMDVEVKAAYREASASNVSVSVSSQKTDLPGAGGCTRKGSGRVSELSFSTVTERTNVVSEWASRRFGGEICEDLAQSLSHNFTFESRTHLRRGVRLSKVMRGCSAIFATSVGTSAHYEMSEPAYQLQYFLSHNWSVPRWQKHLALCFAFNFKLALVTGVLVELTLLLLTSFDLSPTLYEPEREIRSCMLSRSVMAPILTCLLLFGSNVRATLRISNPIVFLDKACIHQTDGGEKTLGIAKLGAFLDCSDRMLILYSDVYLQRVWTIYEVANFLSLRSSFAMDVVPVQLPIVIFAALPFSYLYTSMLMIWRYLGYASLAGAIRYVILSVVGFAYMVFIRRWAREKIRTKTQLREFDLNTCACALEADREIIYRKIADLMRVVHLPLRNASVPEALEAFNALVRVKMPEALDLIFGTITFRYQHLLFISLALSCRWADYAVFTGCSQREVITYWLLEATWFFSLWPAMLCLSEVLASSFLWMQRFDFLWIVVCGGLIALPFALVHQVLKHLRSRSSDDDLHFAAFAILTCSTLVGTWIFVALHRAFRMSASKGFQYAQIEVAGLSPPACLASRDLDEWKDKTVADVANETSTVHV